jgi:Rrf2 family transcriptional regulator, nitric oxide-sensitive transcriptional repressor
MFSQTAEYALRAIVYLAGPHEAPCTTREIAKITRVPSGYLAKVMQSLHRGGLVTAQRGLHGGFALARPADEITALDVMQAVDPLKRIEHCPLGLKGHHTLCPLHRRLDSAVALVEDALRNSTIAELQAAQKHSKMPQPLCSMIED